MKEELLCIYVQNMKVYIHRCSIYIVKSRACYIAYMQEIMQNDIYIIYASNLYVIYYGSIAVAAYIHTPAAADMVQAGRQADRPPGSRHAQAGRASRQSPEPPVVQAV